MTDSCPAGTWSGPVDENTEHSRLMDEEALILSGIQPETNASNRWTSTGSATKTIVKPAWLTRSTPASPTPLSTDNNIADSDSSSDNHQPIPSCSSTPARQQETTAVGERVTTRSVNKRKNPTKTTPRSTKVKKKSDPGAEVEIVDDVEMTDNTKQREDAGSNMDGLKSFFKDQIDLLKNDMRSDMKGAVEKITNQVTRNTENIEKIRVEVDTKIERTVAAAVTRELRKHNIGSHGVSERGNSATDNDYWRARRSVRCWPIVGPDNDLWGLTGDFFSNIMGIPGDNLPQNSVQSVRRVSRPRSNRPQKIQNEVLVIFKEVSTRDMVFSYAPNLARYRQSKSPPGIRIEFPDHLRGAFSTLEKYGLQLRTELGESFKRSIKFDDSSMSLRIDAKFPGEERWEQIPLEIAAEEVEKRKRQDTAATRERINSVSGPSGACPRRTRSPPPAANGLPQSSRLHQYRNENPPARWGTG